MYAFVVMTFVFVVSVEVVNIQKTHWS